MPVLARRHCPDGLARLQTSPSGPALTAQTSRTPKDTRELPRVDGRVRLRQKVQRALRARENSHTLFTPRILAGP